MTDILTESFCERCGTRYTFEATQRRRRAGGIKRAGLLARGLKNYVLSDDPLGEALAEAHRDEDRRLATSQLDDFHQTFNFCIECRQYACSTCWNEAEGRCLTCAPTAQSPELDRLLGLTAEHSAPAVGGIGRTSNERPTFDTTAWPEIDLHASVAPASAAAEIVARANESAIEERPEAEPVPEPAVEAVVAEPVPEPAVEAVVAEPLPEPVVAEAEAVEPAPEPVVAEVEAVEPAPEPVEAPASESMWTSLLHRLGLGQPPNARPTDGDDAVPVDQAITVSDEPVPGVAMAPAEPAPQYDSAWVGDVTAVPLPEPEWAFDPEEGVAPIDAIWQEEELAPEFSAAAAARKDAPAEAAGPQEALLPVEAEGPPLVEAAPEPEPMLAETAETVLAPPEQEPMLAVETDLVAEPEIVAASVPAMEAEPLLEAPTDALPISLAQVSEEAEAEELERQETAALEAVPVVEPEPAALEVPDVPAAAASEAPTPPADVEAARPTLTPDDVPTAQQPATEGSPSSPFRRPLFPALRPRPTAPQQPQAPAPPPPAGPQPPTPSMPGWQMVAPEAAPDSSQPVWPPQGPVYQPPAGQPSQQHAPTPDPLQMPSAVWAHPQDSVGAGQAPPVAPPTAPNVWEASSRGVLNRPGSGVRPCHSCGLALSANARFCRRCGTRQG